MAELVPFSLAFSADAIRAYGGTGEHVHSSQAAAEAYGLPGIIVWGTLLVAPFHDLVARHAGADWLQGGALESQIKKPVFADEAVRYSGRIVAENLLELQAETERNGIVATARATLSKNKHPQRK
jgi:acyl dehydratase